VTLAVVGLGGNALVRRGQRLDAGVQRANAKLAAECLTELAASTDIVLTHGNGPQVGLLALQSDACTDVAPYPLDVLDAETEGMVGYVLEQELGNRLGPERMATLLTQVVVDADDPAFKTPTKPIGPLYDAPTAHRLAAERGWSIARDGAGWRRVVASPEPVRIVELAVIRLLVRNRVVVTCAGGGGIPVLEDEVGCHRGVEAVVDKDLVAALLAAELGADLLLLLTDVDAVYDHFGRADAVRIDAATPATLRAMAFAPGSMAPKIDAACRFVERTGGTAVIGALDDAARVARHESGTIVTAA
jgi:carbamate kinase